MTETSPTTGHSAGRTATSYDAIVVGGGHNGLTNAAYLAKSGLRTLVLEQRHLRRRRGHHRGAAAGVLVHHVLVRAEPAAARDRPRAQPGRARVPAADDAGRLPPDRRRRLPALRRRRRAERADDPAALAARRRRLHALQLRPRPGHPDGAAAVRQPAARHLRQRPGGPGRRRLDAQAPRQRRPEDDPRHRADADRQRGRPARRLLRVRAAQGLPRVVLQHRQPDRPDVRRLRPRAALPQDGRARRAPRLLVVPQGRQRRLHPGARSRGAVVRRRDRARRARRPGADPRRPGRSAWCWPTAPS